MVKYSCEIIANVGPIYLFVLLYIYISIYLSIPIAVPPALYLSIYLYLQQYRQRVWLPALYLSIFTCTNYSISIYISIYTCNSTASMYGCQIYIYLSICTCSSTTSSISICLFIPVAVPPACMAARSEITHSGELNPRTHTASNLINTNQIQSYEISIFYNIRENLSILNFSPLI